MACDGDCHKIVAKMAHVQLRDCRLNVIISSLGSKAFVHSYRYSAQGKKGMNKKSEGPKFKSQLDPEIFSSLFSGQFL